MYVSITFAISSVDIWLIAIFCSLLRLLKLNSDFSPDFGNSSPVNTLVSGFTFCSFTMSASFVLFITYSFKSFKYPIPPFIAVAVLCSFCLIIPTTFIFSAFAIFSFIKSLSSLWSIHKFPCFS